MSNLTDDARIAELASEMPPKMLRLADAMLKGKGLADARRESGYASDQSASNTTKNVKFREYMALCRKKIESNKVMTRDRAVEILSDIAEGKGRFSKSSGSEAKGAIDQAAKILGWHEPEKQEVKGSLVDRLRKGRRK